MSFFFPTTYVIEVIKKMCADRLRSNKNFKAQKVFVFACFNRSTIEILLNVPTDPFSTIFE